MADAHKNFAYSTVATAPSPATSGTSLVVAAGDGAKFPAAPFNATIWPVSAQPTTANAEIVRVTAISTDTLTISRAQESTSARTVVIGDQIAESITAKTLTDVELNVYVTDQDKTIPATTEVIFESYLELSASFFYELSTDAILVIGDFATPVPLPDQNPNIFISVADETVPANSEVIFSDFYELSAPFAMEVSANGELQLGTGSSVPLSILAVTQYAPATAVTYNVTNAAGVTALDTTNLTVSFAVPPSAAVIVQFSAAMTAPGSPAVLGFGLLNHFGGAQVGYGLSNVLVSGVVATLTLTWYLTGLSAGTLQLDVAAGVSAGTGQVFAQGFTGAITSAKVGPATITVFGV